MAEIRSTIDLIMERTRGMALSADEKESLRREEFSKRAKGLRLKLLDNPAGVDEILSALGAESEEDRTLLQTLLWEEMAQAVPADESALPQLQLLRKLPQGESKASILAQMRSFIKARLKDRSRDRRAILMREEKKLAAFGISGTAVVPKIPKQSLLGRDSLEVWERLKAELRDGNTE